MKLSDQIAFFQALHDAVVVNIKQIDQEVEMLFEVHDSTDVGLKLKFYRVHLRGCEKIKFTFWDGEESFVDVYDISNHHLHIIDAKQEGKGVLINCMAEEGGGYLYIKTKTIHVYDRSNIELEFEEFIKQIMQTR